MDYSGEGILLIGYIIIQGFYCWKNDLLKYWISKNRLEFHYDYLKHKNTFVLPNCKSTECNKVRKQRLSFDISNPNLESKLLSMTSIELQNLLKTLYARKRKTTNEKTELVREILALAQACRNAQGVLGNYDLMSRIILFLDLHSCFSLTLVNKQINDAVSRNVIWCDTAVSQCTKRYMINIDSVSARKFVIAVYQAYENRFFHASESSSKTHGWKSFLAYAKHEELLYQRGTGSSMIIATHDIRPCHLFEIIYILSSQLHKICAVELFQKCVHALASCDTKTINSLNKKAGYIAGYITPDGTKRLDSLSLSEFRSLITNKCCLQERDLIRFYQLQSVLL